MYALVCDRLRCGIRWNMPGIPLSGPAGWLIISVVSSQRMKSKRRRARLICCAAASMAMSVSPRQSSAAQLHFDTPLSYNSSKFPILNYASISGNYLNMKTDGQRSLITGNNNVLASYYNNFLADYATQPN